ncbi:MAG: FIST C-terminal domain-containing protein [Elusimicrobia bacterium]|nr:FIST C-terminal domain-containing protein [Elusimicrobiota bacterium]
MEWASALSEHADTAKAVAECSRAVREGKDGPPDVAFVFPSSHHSEHYQSVPALIVEELGAKHVLGCSGGGIIGAGREVERKAALSVVAGWLPGAQVRVFHVTQETMPSPDAPPREWREWTGVEEPKADFMLLSDPFTLDPEECVQGLDYAFPATTKVGGLASGGLEPETNVLYADRRVFKRGAVGAAFWGDVAIDPVVAQGCRPIGAPMQVTSCDKNLLIELEGKRTLKVLEELLGGLDEDDKKLARNSLFIGLLSDPMKKTDATGGDYLIRNLVGIDPEKGVLAVGAMLRPGQTIQFHLRDRRASAADLDRRLARYAADGAAAAAGAVLFSCLGRGQGLYRKANHDTDAFKAKMGSVPLGGFFANGEIGPVDGTTYLHGYTSCFGIFRPARKET